MTASDLTIIAPFVAAILLAAAILVMDFIAPDRTVPALFVTFIGLTIIGALIVITGQHPGALLLRLGAFPFWRGPEPLPDALVPVYERAATAALEVLADLMRKG